MILLKQPFTLRDRNSVYILIDWIGVVNRSGGDFDMSATVLCNKHVASIFLLFTFDGSKLTDGRSYGLYWWYRIGKLVTDN